MAGLIAREVELGVLRRVLLAHDSRARGLCIKGEIGIGKSALWSAGCEEVERAGARLLSCRPAEAEARYAHAGLRDLVEPVADEVLPSLPGAQRAALEVALLRSAAKRVDHRTVSVAVLSALRWLARSEAICVAVDDLQWLDRPTARLLAYALRRLPGDRVRLLASWRTGARHAFPDDLLEQLDGGAVESLRLGPLDASSIREILLGRLEHRLPPALLARVVDAAGGNPLFALEIGQAVAERPAGLELGRPLPVPERIRALMRRRLAELPASALPSMRVAAALYRPTVEAVARAVPDGGAALATAARAGLLHLRGDEVHFVHPLLASVVYSETSAEHLHWVHRRLAEVVEDEEERARHLALASEGPDAATAAALDHAAAAAASRGAPDAGAELMELAARLTPAHDEDQRRRRVITAAGWHFDVGTVTRGRDLLERLLELDLPTALRSDVLATLGVMTGYAGDLAEARVILAKAAAAAGDDGSRRCACEQLLTYVEICAADFSTAHRRAVETLQVAEALDDPRLVSVSLAYAAFTGFVLGRGAARDLLDRAVALEAWADPLVERNPRFLRAAVLRFAGDLDGARRDFETCLLRFREAGEYAKIPSVAWHLSELECWAGNWTLADRLATEATETAQQSGSNLPLAYALGSRAVIDAHLGRVDSARQAAEQGLALSARAGDRMSTVTHRSALGFLALSLGDPREAHEQLGPLAAALEQAGVADPGILRFLPDEIEALIALGDVEAADGLLRRFEEQARELGRAWALAAGARCRAQIHAARGTLPDAATALEAAMRHHAALDQPFERARTLLVVGDVQRRLRQKLAPREAFREALHIFEALGAEIWAERARDALARATPQAPAPLALSPMERRVAAHAAAGRTNREIATLLAVSPKTVEANLGRIYRKLGVRSRTELARRWAGPEGGPAGSKPGPGASLEGPGVR